ncbi:hypothetical protein AB0H43_25170 [Hamadaea sp. NPDC050747]|uniref:hypothetical protein n=1 Tax=Hamadaea sp. NPDC050747 TaxID=3155789 RepID=UPI0033FB9178
MEPDNAERDPLPKTPDPLADWLEEPGSTAPGRSSWLPILAIVVCVALLSGAAYALVKLRKHPAPGSGLTAGQTALASPGSAWARDFPVSTKADLDGVCRGWYYPQSPAATGPAPHPITVTVLDNAFKMRLQPLSVHVPDGVKKQFRDAWQPADLAKVQIVACVDLVGSGKPLGKCSFTSPKVTTVPFVEGIYQITAYEVATGRKLTEARVIGAEECPLVALVPADDVLHSEVSDRQLYDKLHALVER